MAVPRAAGAQRVLPGHTGAGLAAWDSGTARCRAGPGGRARRSDVVRLTSQGSCAFAGAARRVHSNLCGSFDLC